MRSFAIMSSLVILVSACGSSRERTTRDSGPIPDGCTPVTCALYCEYGFARDAGGCEVCSCNPAPADTCAVDAECALAIDYADCCGCAAAFTQSRVDLDRCVAGLRETPPVGCRDETMCAGVACRCAPPTRAVCEMGRCVARYDCPDGQLPALYSCVPACASHADCALAADYGVCCGGCSAHHVQTIDEDPCLARTAAESSCSPAPGACDGLGCPSPPTDCSFGGASAVCMADGSCSYGGADGACPGGSMEMDGVCVPVGTP